MGYWDTPGRSDEWFTPPQVFKAIGCRFDLDVAAPLLCYCAPGAEHVPCDRRIVCGSLTKPWHGFVWMNPPFGGRRPGR